MESTNITQKFDLFNEHWTPKIIGECNGQHVKIAKVKDSFVWHSHEQEDELFMCYKGTLYIELRENITISVKPGEMYIVPKGVEHRPYTNGEEVWILMFEPIGTVNTGSANDSELRVTDLKKI
jgi:mannose-6-phosphate isomerase-like protein (cupin superfamily)